MGAIKAFADRFVDRIDVSADANDIVIELGMTDAQIAALFFGAIGTFATPSSPAPVSP
jgi:hypothetical protein